MAVAPHGQEERLEQNWAAGEREGSELAYRPPVPDPGSLAAQVLGVHRRLRPMMGSTQSGPQPVSPEAIQTICEEHDLPKGGLVRALLWRYIPGMDAAWRHIVTLWSMPESKDRQPKMEAVQELAENGEWCQEGRKIDMDATGWIEEYLHGG